MKPAYSSWAPVAATLAAKASLRPLELMSGPTVTGNVDSVEKVTPVT